MTGRGRRRDDRALLILWAMIAAFVAVFAWIALIRHWSFQSGRFDLGNMVQATWTTGRGDLLGTTDTIGTQISRLGAHVDPILVVFTPFSWFLPTAEVLLFSQVAIVALGALPVFWLGRRWLGDDRLALAGAAVYLLLPAVQFPVLIDFHPVTLATPLLLFCIWAAEEQRWWTLAAFAIPTVLTKEQVGLALTMLGLWIAVRHRKRLAGAILAVAAGAWAAIAVFVIMPAYNPYGDQLHVQRYGALGNSAGEILTTVITRPWVPVEIMVSWDRLTYLLALLLPLLALSLLSPMLAACALPELVLNLLGAAPQHTVGFHYSAVIIPFLVASALLGLARLRSWRRSAPLVRAVARPGPVAVVMVLAVVVAGLRLGPFPWAYDIPLGANGISPVFWTLEDPDHGDVLEEAMEVIPGDAVVSATNHAGGHLSERRRVLLYPYIDDAEWVLVDGKYPGLSLVTDPRAFVACLRGMDTSPNWEVAFADTTEGVIVYRHNPNPSPATLVAKQLAPDARDPATCRLDLLPE